MDAPQDASIIEEQGGVFLDPKSCGSTIQWAVNFNLWLDAGGKYRPMLDGTVRMSDCSRLITWDISGPEGIKKLDNAIRELTVCRAELQLALDKQAAWKAKEGDK